MLACRYTITVRGRKRKKIDLKHKNSLWVTFTHGWHKKINNDVLIIHSLTSVYIYGKIRVQLSQKLHISWGNLCRHDSAFWKTEAQISCEERCTFSCTERIVEAAVSDSPPDLPITDMQSGFPQLFCSAGLGFSFTHCIRCQKNKRVSVYCRHQKKFRFKSALGCLHPQPEFLLPQHLLLLSAAIPPCNPVLLSMHYPKWRHTFSGMTLLYVHIWPASTYILIRVESANLCALFSFSTLVKTGRWWSLNCGSRRVCNRKAVPKVSDQPMVKLFLNPILIH